LKPVIGYGKVITMPNIVKLAPIRMSEIKANADTGSPAKSIITPTPTPMPNTPARYAPPNRRPAPVTPVVVSLDFNSEAFPSLHESPIAKGSTVTGFKQKILDLIAKEALDEAERNRVIEEDPKKMTKEELLNAGWAILPLGNLKESGLRFNQNMLSYKLAEIHAAPYQSYV
jgi:hypothetical protein